MGGWGSPGCWLSPEVATPLCLGPPASSVNLIRGGWLKVSELLTGLWHHYFHSNSLANWLASLCPRYSLFVSSGTVIPPLPSLPLAAPSCNGDLLLVQHPRSSFQGVRNGMTLSFLVISECAMDRAARRYVCSVKSKFILCFVMKIAVSFS